MLRAASLSVLYPLYPGQAWWFDQHLTVKQMASDGLHMSTFAKPLDDRMGARSQGQSKEQSKRPMDPREKALDCGAMCSDLKDQCI